ncbi:MAG: acetyltransferase [Lachnospiraceae bacterium]|uniref:Acetyltransferase n=1 Tax=Candidatus Weimeria bifida TaxID=2599074 RepID=A0A6N7J094_9FIRM|nr:acetyltransferase [Candidatus Weimeria bifida]RRF96799.1 MAG: acetyltransferase [Lachnospiraceae bacterium]
MPAVSSKKRIAGMDGLRAIAIIGIVIYHMLPDVLSGGFLGVSMFFALSGFLITLSESKSYERNHRINFGRFFYKRIRRIYPAMLMTLFVTVILLAIFIPESLKNIRGEAASIIFGYNNIWQIHMNGSYFSNVSSHSAFIHMWSLAVELQFYLVFPFIFWLIKKIEKETDIDLGFPIMLALAVASIIAGIAAFKPGTDPTPVYYGTFTRIGTLFLGSALAFLYEKNRLPRFNNIVALPVLAGLIAAMVILYITTNGTDAVTYRVILPVFSIICAFVIVLISGNDTAGRILDVAPLQIIGRMSYETYLVMYPVIFIVSLKIRLGSQYKDAVLEVALIVACTVLLHIFSKYLTPIGLARTIQEKSFKKNTGYLVTAALSAVAVIIIFISPALVKKDDSAELQAQLEANAKKSATQAEQPAKPAKPAKKPSPSKPDKPAAAKKASGNAAKKKKPAKKPADNSKKIKRMANKSVTMFGDSVMLGSYDVLRKKFPNAVIDASVSRQARDAASEIIKQKQAGKLGNIVIIELGTNGAFSSDTFEKIMGAIGADRQVYWILPYGKQLQWQDTVISELKKYITKHNNITLIDWPSLASKHPEWFYSDGTHLKTDGQKGFADLILDSVGQ